MTQYCCGSTLCCYFLSYLWARISSISTHGSLVTTKAWATSVQGLLFLFCLIERVCTPVVLLLGEVLITICSGKGLLKNLSGSGLRFFFFFPLARANVIGIILLGKKKRQFSKIPSLQSLITSWWVMAVAFSVSYSPWWSWVSYNSFSFEGWSL